MLGPSARGQGFLAPGHDAGGAQPLGVMVGARPLGAMLGGTEPLGVMLGDARPLGAVMGGAEPLGAMLGDTEPLGVMVGAQPLGVMLEDARPLGAGTGVLLEHSPVGKSARRAGKKFADACFALLQSSDLLGLLKESRFGNDQKG